MGSSVPTRRIREIRPSFGGNNSQLPLSLCPSSHPKHCVLQIVPLLCWEEGGGGQGGGGRGAAQPWTDAGRAHAGSESAQQQLSSCSWKMRPVFLAQSQSLSPRGGISAFVIEVSGEMGFTWQEFGVGDGAILASRGQQGGCSGGPDCPVGAGGGRYAVCRGFPLIPSPHCERSGGFTRSPQVASVGFPAPLQGLQPPVRWGPRAWPLGKRLRGERWWGLS